VSATLREAKKSEASIELIDSLDWYIGSAMELRYWRKISAVHRGATYDCDCSEPGGWVVDGVDAVFSGVFRTPLDLFSDIDTYVKPSMSICCSK
jgi:hypothetical protein